MNIEFHWHILIRKNCLSTRTRSVLFKKNYIVMLIKFLNYSQRWFPSSIFKNITRLEIATC